jgi:coenzyme PQQ biosynthesis protein C
MKAPLTPDQLEARLRRIGAERYHDKHPFHRLMNSGDLTKAQLQAWALNRYYYQAIIPMKDAAIMSRMETAGLRRTWRQRIVDHDGDDADSGGIARWIALTEGLGLDRAYVESTIGILPATRFAVDAYLHFVREKSLLEAIASSLTEMFSKPAITERLSSMLARYDFLSRELLGYFDKRLSQAPRDADFALNYVKREARTIEDQKKAIAALDFKCSVLWSQLDALCYAYVSPGLIPPGAFVPEKTA